MGKLTENEAKRALAKEFEDVNGFIGSIKGVKKYAYAFAKRLGCNTLVLDTLKFGWQESGLYRMQRDMVESNEMQYSIAKYTDGLIHLLDSAVSEYTFKNTDWGRKNHKYHGSWVPPSDKTMESIHVNTLFAKKRYYTYPYYNYHSNYFFLNTHNSMIFFDIKAQKMVRGSLITLQHPIFKTLEDCKKTLQKVLSIQNVDVRKNILGQLSFDYLKYAEVEHKEGNYELIAIKYKSNRAEERRVYLKMINPSTEEIHVEAVHPNCRTVLDAINFRRYGTTSPPTNVKSLNWSPIQLS